MHAIFPEIEPYKTHRIQVSEIHNLYVEECGNPEGYPVVFIHGGPGAGITGKHRRIFDPAFFRIILFDQRGAGKSTPHANLVDNTTQHLIADIELLRTQLNIGDKWLVFGGSWGSTLGLAYAEAYPEHVSGLILRGIFLCRDEEIKWFYQEGCHNIYPDLWEDYIRPIPLEERGDFLTAFHKRLTSDDEATRLEAARAWSGWEGGTIKLIPEPVTYTSLEDDLHALAMARIECHYFMNHIFLEKDQLLTDAHKIKHIPTWIVHGRYDVICPVKNAFDLRKELPDAKLTIVPDAGHAFSEPGIMNALIQALEEFRLAPAHERLAPSQ